MTILLAIVLFVVYAPVYFGLTYYLVKRNILPENFQTIWMNAAIAKRNKRLVAKTFNEENYTFKDDAVEEVLTFIALHPETIYLLNMLPSLVEQFYGSHILSISLFQSYEDDWQNLYVDLPRSHSLTLDEEFEIKDKLFAKLDKDPKAVLGLYNVTLSV